MITPEEVLKVIAGFSLVFAVLSFITIGNAGKLKGLIEVMIPTFFVAILMMALTGLKIIN